MDDNIPPREPGGWSRLLPGDGRSATPRNAGIDSLRAAATLLVVLHHTAITYGAIGGWYYKEALPDGSPSSTLLVLFCTLNQAWFMGFFFLLAGYFTPGALRRKGPWRYFGERLVRLGLPLLVYGFVLGPITIALAQTSRGKPFGETLMRLWHHAEFEKGPLWFAWALLLFALAAVLWFAAMKQRVAAGDDVRTAFPSNAALLVAALATGAGAFALRLVWPVGREAFGLQLGYFSSYIVLFAAGCMAARPRWLARLPAAQVRTWRRIAWLAFPTLPVIALAARHGGWRLGPVEGGWTVLAAFYAFWEPFVAWGVILGLLVWAQRRLASPGEVWRRLARRAYAIYAIHPLFVVGVALSWRAVAAPPVLKFAVTGTLACVLCYLAAGLLLKVPGVKRVL